jgi:serine protease inhibitor
VTRNFYGTQGATPSDFKQRHDQERQRINEWVASQTRDKIKNLLEKGSIDSSTRMVLVNAIYFQGFWISPFKKSNTTSQPFHLASGNKINARLMQQRFEVGVRYGAFRGDGTFFETPEQVPPQAQPSSLYPADDGFQMVEIPYNGDGMVMTILLPRKPNGLPDLLSKITSESLKRWHESLVARETDVLIPRFRMETKLELRKTLEAMGMSIPFNCSPGVADFSGISSGDQGNLCIAKAIHQAMVEVNEEGTEAAAATGIILAPTSAPVFENFVPEFRADRPFVFLIRDTTSGIVLFVGCMHQPS